MSGVLLARLAAALLAGAVVVLLRAPQRRVPVPPAATGRGDTSARQGSPVTAAGLSLGAGAGAWVFLGGALGVLAAPVVAVGCWRALRRAEPTAVRRAREEAARELPHLVGLLAAGLRAGAPPSVALGTACAALPGPVADSLAGVRARLELGVEPGVVWGDLGADPALGPLGRALSRAHRTGASVLDTVEQLALTLAEEARAGTEDRARAVGVRAAVPLGLCLLPAFLLLGIVPLVAGLVGQLAWG